MDASHDQGGTKEDMELSDTQEIELRDINANNNNNNNNNNNTQVDYRFNDNSLSLSLDSSQAEGDGITNTTTDYDEAASTTGSDEMEKKVESSSLRKLITTLLTIVTLLFTGAGALYGIEAKHEERETGVIEDWKYLNCVYFCVVTLTTIGYGDLTPKTPGGKVFIVLYALVSLGVMAAAVTSIGQVIVARANKQKNDFVKVSTAFTKKLRRLANLPTQPSEKDLQEAMKKEMEEKQKASFKRFIFRLIGLLTLIAICIFVGARIFTALEGWPYGDSVYYCCITLLTIGYGDYYPHTDGGKIFFIFYAFIGLGLLAFVVGDIGEKILSHTQAQLQEAKLQKAFQKKIQLISKISKFPTKIVGKKSGSGGMSGSSGMGKEVEGKAADGAQAEGANK